MSLNQRFKISEATEEDMDDTMRIMEKAMATDELWHLIVKDCDPEEVHQWVMTNLTPRWNMPDITTYKITEVSTKKFAGWTALQYPWDKFGKQGQERYMSPENRAHAISKDMPRLPKGMEPELALEFFHMLTATEEYGFNPENDFHRKGTMIHPDFQKMGLGTALTRHTNEIMDKVGARTWAPARPSSYKMFLNEGFTLRGTVDSHLEKWGGSREKSLSYMCCRDPPLTTST